MKKFLLALLVVIIVAAISYMMFMEKPTVRAPETILPNSAVQDTDEVMNAKNIVRYSAGGYSPATITIKAGESVTFVNEGEEAMWTASDDHPTHTLYNNTDRKEHCPDPKGLAFDQCGASEEFVFRFKKEGSFSYHNHLRAEHGGTVVVE